MSGVGRLAADVYLPIGPLESFLGPMAHGCKGEMSRYHRDDLARLAGASRRTVQRWRRAGELPLRWADRIAVQLGVHPLAIWSEHYEAWLNGELAPRYSIMAECA